jgi:hypothetical protein
MGSRISTERVPPGPAVSTTGITSYHLFKHAAGLLVSRLHNYSHHVKTCTDYLHAGSALASPKIRCLVLMWFSLHDITDQRNISTDIF